MNLTLSRTGLFPKWFAQNLAIPNIGANRTDQIHPKEGNELEFFGVFRFDFRGPPAETAPVNRHNFLLNQDLQRQKSQNNHPFTLQLRQTFRLDTKDRFRPHSRSNPEPAGRRTDLFSDSSREGARY